MKFLPAQLSYLFSQAETRRNLGAFLRFIAMLVLLIVVYSLLFHMIMERFEGEYHSYVTGFYWTLTVMTTLGFGDITFESDVGRLFSIVVLVSGVLLLLIVLPFSFIRYFYAPWLEAQIRLKAPRAVRPEVSGHVVLCSWDDLARGLVERLRIAQIPYCVIEPDPAAAASLMSEGVSVVTGEVDARDTYAKVNAAKANLIIANLSDPTNTNITLTVREETADVPVAAIVQDREAADILDLSGATHSIALKDRLGEQLAGRVSAGRRTSHVLGRYGQLVIAEFPVRGTRFAGMAVKNAGLRRSTGLSFVGVWERGALRAARPELVFGDHMVAVTCGSAEQVAALDALLADEPIREQCVMVIGGGRVGFAVIRALKARGLKVHVVEADKVRAEIRAIADKVVEGSAIERAVMNEAGIADAASVVLTTNDDSINAFLAIYCRKLNPDLHIVSRITHERNINAIYRAGADFVLSYTALGVKQLMAIVQHDELVLLGEGVDLFALDVTPALVGKSLAEAHIGARTGLTVIGTQRGDVVEAISGAAAVLEQGARLVAVGTPQGRMKFQELFE